MQSQISQEKRNGFAVAQTEPPISNEGVKARDAPFPRTLAGVRLLPRSSNEAEDDFVRMSGLPAVTKPNLSYLLKLDLFAGIAPGCIDAICTSGRMDYFGKEEFVFEQGGTAERAYALAEGSIRIVQTGSDGKQAIIRFIAPGEMFGTVPLFTDHVFPGDAITVEPSKILSWSEEDILTLVDRYPRIAINVIRIIGQRLAEVQNRMRELATQRSEQRIAHTLLRLAAQVGHNADGGEVINIPLRRKDIAEASGTTLHTASRTLAAWQKAGLLVTHGQRLIISDLSEIGQIGDGLDQ